MTGTSWEAAPDGAPSERTILFADVADSTRLYLEEGDESAKRVLLSCIDVMSAAATQGGGRVLERIGDEILCLFETPDAAARAAAETHRRVEEASKNGAFPRPLSVRIGFEHGPAILTGDQVFGGTVHAAARLVALAKAGQTLTTRETLGRMAPFLQRLSRSFDRVVLKGQPGERDVHELLWDPRATVVAASTTRAQKTPGRAVSLELSHDGRRYRVDAACPRLDLGRHPTCGLRVETPCVSKLHARVVWDRGRVRLEDLSTNGTFVEQDGAPPLFLHHEGVVLSGRGRLMLGAENASDAASSVTYHCLPTDP